MSDEPTSAAALSISPAEARVDPAPPSDPAPNPIGDECMTAPPASDPAAPMGFVRGGTGTERSQRLFERRFQEAEARRDEAAAQAELAKGAVEHRYEAETGQSAVAKLPGRPGGAVQYTTQFTQHPEVPKAYIHLVYLTRTGAESGLQCCADLIVGADPTRPTELCLVLVCPHCAEHSHKHQQDNQLRIFQSNKYFEFRASAGPKTFEFRDPISGEIEIYNSAGVIIECEPFRCPDCGWRARIVQNRVRPD